MKVVYITGCGRSGSTLLDLILGTSPGSFSVGQCSYLQFFLNEHDPRSPAKTRFLDDMSNKPGDSPVWRPIGELVKAENLSLYDPRCPLSLAKALLGGKNPIETFDDIRLYQAVAEAAGPVIGTEVTHVIDSSKDLKRLIALHQHPDLEVLVIHLVRDVRGYVYSIMKREMPWMPALRRWVTVNILTEWYLKRTVPASQRMQINYDAFCADPETTIRKINATFGMSIPGTDIPSHITDTPSYRFSGSGMRLQGVSEIRHDTSWREKMPAGIRGFITLTCGLLNRHWGRPKVGRHDTVRLDPSSTGPLAS